MTTAIVNFRTMANGSYKWTRGLTRGWWRVLIVKDVAGSTSINSYNVVSSPYNGPEGLHGVTARSSYDISASRIEAQRIASEINAKTLAFELGCDAIAALCSENHPTAHAAALASESAIRA